MPGDGDYSRSILFTLAASASETSVAFRSLRFRPWDFFVKMCRFVACDLLTFPLDVSLKRFTAPLLLLSLSFALGFLMIRSFPSSDPAAYDAAVPP